MRKAEAGIRATGRGGPTQRASRLEGLLALTRERIVVFDGGLGTTLARMGAPAVACNEALVQTDPELVYRAHAAFFEAGADAVETDTLGGARHMLEEHKLGAQCFVLNRQAAELAHRAARDYATRDRPCFVAGSIGPGAKLPSLGQIAFAELVESYTPQVEGLLAGSVDCLIVETSQDLLQMKAALVAIDEVFARLGKRVPVIAQFTVDASGRTLVGSDGAAMLAALEPFPVAAIGLNCGLGPEQMTAEVLYLGRHSSRLLSVMPNAGLPKLVNGRPVYSLSPESFAEQMKRFALNPGLNIAGGCCGTGPEHIRALVRALADVPPRKPQVAGRKPQARVSSLFRAQEAAVRPKPLICGERTNASGSKRFRDLLQARDYDGMLRAAVEQEREGAHLVDLSVAAAGRQEATDMAEVCQRLNTGLSVPVMVDARDPQVVEAALQRLGGRSVVNSVTLEDPGRAHAVIELCRKYGAGLVLLTVDERGMAMTCARKLSVAGRLYKLALAGGLAPESLFLDFLTFTLGSGERALRRAAVETLAAVKAARKRFPASLTLLGVSNVSHGLEPGMRRALNTVFLARAIEHGLDAAIVHAGRIQPLSELEPKIVRSCDDLVFNRREDALARMIEQFSRTNAERGTQSAERKTPKAGPGERLKEMVLSGGAAGLEETLAGLLSTETALRIVEKRLLPAMDEVGRRFEAGRMPLPFVLRSAEVMRRAFDVLKPRLPAGGEKARGTLVVATVRGDIHDIGKNLVEMIVSAGGFRVVNLGVRQSPEEILAAVRKHAPDAVGLSGLLVESARAMKEYLEVFAAAGVTVPVICGGAALSREYVARELAPAYAGKVFYARDALAGLKLMQNLCRSSSSR
jgi:5-methyltetrahydrofolate--homocysteine methyltransferase